VAWTDTRLTELLGIHHPIVQAPMAGGPSTVELVAAVSEAGGLGSIGAAGMPPDDLRAAIQAVRLRTNRPFAVNVFADVRPQPAPPERVETARRELDRRRERVGLPPAVLPEPPAWGVADQLAVVAEERVPVVSFTFGIPPFDGLGGAVTMGTATTVEEALALERAGASVVVAQGAEAGGHRGTFLVPFDEGMAPLASLVPQIAGAVSVPVVAAGGIVDGRGIASALAAGAGGVQLGTAFLFCRESGASDEWRRALRELPTFVTDAYTGRPARGARTPFLEELAAGPPPAPWGVQGALTAAFRGIEGHGWYLGGTGAAQARELPARELVATLAAEALAAAG
jgi:nitronate monooxygenase